MTNITAAAQLEAIALIIRAKAEPTEHHCRCSEKQDPRWKCPTCGDEYSLLDGTRTYRHETRLNAACQCPEMPELLKLGRAVGRVLDQYCRDHQGAAVIAAAAALAIEADSEKRQTKTSQDG